MSSIRMIAVPGQYAAIRAYCREKNTEKIKTALQSLIEHSERLPDGVKDMRLLYGLCMIEVDKNRIEDVQRTFSRLEKAYASLLMERAETTGGRRFHDVDIERIPGDTVLLKSADPVVIDMLRNRVGVGADYFEFQQSGQVCSFVAVKQALPHITSQLKKPHYLDFLKERKTGQRTLNI